MAEHTAASPLHLPVRQLTDAYARGEISPVDVAEEVLYETFVKFSDKEVSKPPFKRIPFAESMV